MWLNIIMHDQKDHSQYVKHNLNKKVQTASVCKVMISYISWNWNNKQQICEGMGPKSFISKEFKKDIPAFKRKKNLWLVWDLPPK